MVSSQFIIPLAAITLGLVGGMWLFVRSAGGTRKAGAAGGLIGNVFWGIVAIFAILGGGMYGALAGAAILLVMVAVGLGNANELTSRDLRASLVNRFGGR